MIVWRSLALAVLALAPIPTCIICMQADDKPASASADRTDPRKEHGGPEFYVSPKGRPNGNGSISNPWDLPTALAQPGAVRPGATIWVRGGTYGSGATIFRSNLVGSADAPILVRAYPGERATIDGGLQIGCCDQDPHPDRGSYTWFQDLEITSSIPIRTGTAETPLAKSELVNALDCWAPGTKLIDLVIHDDRQGIGIWQEARDSEVYGNLIYYNGFQAPDRGHGHGIYLQHDAGKLLVSDNIVHDQFGAGIHAYGSSHAHVRNVTADGNIVFNNGAISQKAQRVDNILFASGSGLANITVQNNFTYHTPDADIGYSRIGWQFDPQNHTVLVRNNYFIGGDLAIMLNRWSAASFTGNTVYSKSKLLALVDTLPGENPKQYVWDRNTYYGSGRFMFAGKDGDWASWRERAGFDADSRFVSGPPHGVWTFVRPNKYEPGRANIAIYNWDHKEKVNVDVSAVLHAGETYELRDSENFYGDPVLTGKYEGGLLAIPMTGLLPAQPNGRVPTPPDHTGPEFGAFILRATGRK